MLCPLFLTQSLQTMILVELNALSPLSNMLSVKDPKTVTVALDGIKNILGAAKKVWLTDLRRKFPHQINFSI